MNKDKQALREIIRVDEIIHLGIEGSGVIKAIQLERGASTVSLTSLKPFLTQQANQKNKPEAFAKSKAQRQCLTQQCSNLFTQTIDDLRDADVKFTWSGLCLRS